MIIWFNKREFDSWYDVEEYKRGYREYPVWPQVGVNGAKRPAAVNTPAAVGYLDAERDAKAVMDGQQGRGD